MRISVNGRPLDREDPETRRVFSQWPSQFTAVLLVSTQADLRPGRYLVAADRITAMPASVFEQVPLPARAGPAGMRMRSAAGRRSLDG
jgi:hypothetical protein